MTEFFGFFNSTEEDERLYQDEDFARYFRQFLGNGIFYRDAELRVQADDETMTTMVQAGSAYINGYMYVLDEEMVLTHDLPEAARSRIDRVVIRLDRRIEQRYIRLFVKKGEPAITPVAPELTRDEFVYELSLAQVFIKAGQSFIGFDQVTDERRDKALCGVVTFPTDVIWEDWERVRDEIIFDSDPYNARVVFRQEIQPVLKEQAQTRAYLELNMDARERLDGAQAVFYDMFDGLAVSNAIRMDASKTHLVREAKRGDTTLAVYDASAAGFQVGNELTIEDNLAREYGTIQHVDAENHLIELSSPLVNTYGAFTSVNRSNILPAPGEGLLKMGYFERFSVSID